MLFTDPARFGHMFWDALGPVIAPMLAGGIPLGLLAGAIFYVLVKPAVLRYQKRRGKHLARRITRQEAAE